MASPFQTLNYFRPNEFNIGDVLTRTWNVLTRNLVTFITLGFLAQLPTLALSLWIAAQRTSDQTPSDLAMRTGLLSFASVLLSMVVSSFCQATVVYAAFQDLRGRAVSVGGSLAHALRRFPAVIGTSIIVGLTFMLGFLLCLVPGMIAIVALAVAIPACVVEKIGPIASFSRSADLTTGYRWNIFGISIAIFVINAVVGLLLRFVTPSISPFATPVVTWLWGGVSTAFSAVFAAMLYHDLRASKEGIDAQEIASVFD